MEIKEMESIIEALLFAAGDPVDTDKISNILEVDKKTVKLILKNMEIKYRNSSRGIIIRQINNSYQLCTRSEYSGYISKLFGPRQKQGLSQAALETLAIIAYKQPVTRARIELIRGVNSDSALARLMERNLAEEAGKLDVPGKPMSYRTTDEFLRCFGFKSVGDLPNLDMQELQNI